MQENVATFFKAFSFSFWKCINSCTFCAVFYWLLDNYCLFRGIYHETGTQIVMYNLCLVAVYGLYRRVICGHLSRTNGLICRQVLIL